MKKVIACPAIASEARKRSKSGKTKTQWELSCRPPALLCVLKFLKPIEKMFRKFVRDEKKIVIPAKTEGKLSLSSPKK